MAYSWSKWNSEIKNREQIVVQGTEHLEDEPLLEVQVVHKTRKAPVIYKVGSKYELETIP